MAVVDIYTNSDLQKGKLAAAANLTGNKSVTAIATFEVGASDSANSVYRVFPDLNPCLIPVDVKVMNDAVGSAVSDVDLGLYVGNKGPVIGKDCLYNGLDLKTAHAKGAAVDGLTAVDIANLGKPLYEIAGHTIANRKDSYDIALTVNVAPSASGTVTLIGTFIQG